MKRNFRSLIYVLICLGLVQDAGAQKTKENKVLAKELQTLLGGFKGVSGLYVEDLKHKRTVALQADTVFPTASMIKVPILLGIAHKLQQKELDYHQTLTYTQNLFYDDGDVVGNLKDSAKIELSKVIMLMLTTSDNTASLWLQQLAGTGTRINAIMDSLGYQHTRVNSRTPGREANRSQYGWGQTSPREMARLMKDLVQGKYFADSLNDRLVRVLGRNYWDEQALSQIPPTVFVASKNGAVNASRSEVVYVKGEGREYVFCLITKNNQDTSWENNNEAWALAKTISKILWEKLR
ncbi:MAG: serine hydrolase [Sphingobacteriia bacterium]|nr:MAG: serine hydrolase [Sphingobacteriia bacterium]